MVDMLKSLLDRLYNDFTIPLFSFVVDILNLVFITPFVLLGLPVWLHIPLLAVFTACLSFYLRKRFRVEEKVRKFNAIFAEKRSRQQDLQLISEKYSRQAMYKVTDDELNDDFNTYLAQHYARYVLIYLLPLFLILGWLNTAFSGEALIGIHGIPYVFSVPANNYGIQGLSVTFVFLLVYVLSLFIGFRLRNKGGE